MMGKDAEVLARVSFTGNALAPFFLEDPRTGSAGMQFAMFAMLDAAEAGSEWPFVAAADAERSLGMMVDGLAASCVAAGGDARRAAGGAVERARDAPRVPISATFCADDSLTWEYRRLFVGPAPKPAPPWGSVYTDHERVVFGEGTLALRTWMRMHGVARVTDDKEPEDHIGLMLALMAWLAENKPALLDEYLRLHLLTWSSHYLDALAKASEHPFYEGLARLTKATLEGIQEKRGVSVERPRFYR